MPSTVSNVAQYVSKYVRILCGINMSENSSVTLPGKVEEIILSSHGPEKVKIKVGDLSQPLRIKNKLTDADGNETRLNPGDDVQITVEAPPRVNNYSRT
jgi:protein involved in polysaccharide export with SLBB domain